MNHKYDTDRKVFFYEQEFYVLSNFSAFQLKWMGITFMTSEHAYQWSKFFLPVKDMGQRSLQLMTIQMAIRHAASAHDAFKTAENYDAFKRDDWKNIKLKIMHDILRAKCEQHEYVRRKLEETGNRMLIEDSWRDGFWGWGENQRGENWLGRLWMQVRDEMRGHYPEAA